jgi:hypothetical protein
MRSKDSITASDFEAQNRENVPQTPYLVPTGVPGNSDLAINGWTVETTNRNARFGEQIAGDIEMGEKILIEKPAYSRGKRVGTWKLIRSKEETWIFVRRAAKIFDLSEFQIYRWIRDVPDFPVRNIGRKLYQISVPGMRSWLAKHSAVILPSHPVSVDKQTPMRPAEKWYLFPDGPTRQLLFGSRAWVSSSEAAKCLGATDWTIRHFMRQPGFPVRNVGIGNAKPFFQVNRFAAKEWMEKNTKVSPERSQYMPTAEDLLRRSRK